MEIPSSVVSDLSSVFGFILGLMQRLITLHWLVGFFLFLQLVIIGLVVYERFYRG